MQADLEDNCGAPHRNIDSQSRLVTGKTAADGIKIHIYFLPGRMVTYQNNRNVNDHGTWMLNKDGDVCITWASLLAGKQNCYQVKVDKSMVTWGNKDMSNSGGLIGGVASMEAKPLN